jgi:hypothetical protein
MITFRAHVFAKRDKPELVQTAYRVCHGRWADPFGSRISRRVRYLDMGFLAVGLAVVLFAVAGAFVRARARHAKRTRDTRAWMQFLHEDLSWLVATAEISSARSR